MNRIGFKLACLIISLIIWMQVASTHDVEETLFLPLELINLPDSCTIAGNEIQELVQVRVRGSKLRLLAHMYFGYEAGRVEIDLAGVELQTRLQRPITIVDVTSDLEILNVLPPAELLYRVDREVTRKLPVVVTTTGKVSSERALLTELTATPDSVAVTGPERFFTNDARLLTQPVDLSRLRGRVSLVQRLEASSAFLIPALEEVEVSAVLAEIESRTLAHVPIVPLVDADQAEVTVYPPVADLIVSGPADSVQALVPADVAVTVPLTGLEAGEHHLRGQVILPDGITLISLEPEEFMAIIGSAQREGEGQ